MKLLDEALSDAFFDNSALNTNAVLNEALGDDAASLGKEGMAQTTAELDRARKLLAENGLPFPPIPTEFLPAFRQVDEWFFATRTVETSPYNFREYVRGARQSQGPDYALIAHAGRGMNSYAIHYYLVQRPLHLFVQIGWGGAYMDGEEAARDLKNCFDLSERLLVLLPKAVRAGRLSDGDRLIVGASDFYGSSVDLISARPENSTSAEFQRPWDAIKAAISLVETPLPSSRGLHH